MNKEPIILEPTLDPNPVVTIPDEATAPTTPWRSKGMILSLILAGFCVAIGSASSLVIRQCLPSSTTSAEDSSPTDCHDQMFLAEAALASDARDEAILSGDFKKGLEQTRESQKTSAPELVSRLDYREALCLEGLGRWDEAHEAYRRAVDQKRDAIVWAWALLGQARCAAATGNRDSARILLGQAILRSGSAAGGKRELLQECLYMRARLRVLDLQPSFAPDPLDSAALAWPTGDDIEPVLERLLTGVALSESITPPTHEDGPIDVTKGAESPEAIDLSGHVPLAPISEHIESLARATGLSIQIAPEAKTRLSQHSSSIEVQRLALIDILDTLTESFGLVWRIDNGTIMVTPEIEQNMASRRIAAMRSLQTFLTAAPEHPAERTAEIWRANIEFEEKRWHRAAGEYRRILEAAPYASESLFAVYNLGVGELRTGNLPQARSRFLDAVDRRPKTRWADLGWWWIGRTHLDSADPAAALRPLQTARTGSSREVASAAALGECSCYLLQGDAESARLLLRSARIAPSDSHAALGAMFESIVRYDVFPSEGRKEIVEASIQEARNGEAIGPAGLFIAGQVYRRSGSPESMVELYESAVDKLRGPFVAKMSFAVAERLRETDHRTVARKRYLAVVAANAADLSDRAELGLADLAARDGDGSDCLRRCRGLLRRESTVDRSEVLAVMGRGYELQKKFRLAAEAFAGRIPSE